MRKSISKFLLVLAVFLFTLHGSTLALAADFNEAADLQIGPFVPGGSYSEETTEGYLSLREGNTLSPAANGLPARNDIRFKFGVISVNDGKFLAFATSKKSEMLQTPRHIGVGNTKDEVLAAYGEPDQLNEKFIRGLGWLPVYTYGQNTKEAGLEFYVFKLSNKVVQIRFYSQGLQL